jgi:hypothetical protein
MERKCIDIMLTLNETPGKQGKQGIQSYIADIQWNISDYNDVWKGNPLIYWWYWIKYQGHRESNHILILLNEILSDYNDIHWKEIHRYIDDIEWNIRETGNPIIYCWYWMKYKWVQCCMESKSINILMILNKISGKQGKQGIQ